MNKNLTKAQVAALQLILIRLDPKHPKQRASKEVREALASEPLSLYLRSWVLPMAEFVLNGEEYRGAADDIKRDAALPGCDDRGVSFLQES